MRLSVRQYAQTLLDLCSGKTRAELEVLIDGFLALVRQRGDWKKAPAIADCFSQLFDGQAGQVKASATFAVPPSAADRKKIAEYPARRLGRKIILTETVCPEVVAGALIRYEDKILDMSARRVIADLRAAISS